QRRIASRLFPQARVFPSGEKTREEIWPDFSRIRECFLPVGTSHKIILPSSLADASFVPSEEKARLSEAGANPPTHLSLGLPRVRMALPVATCQSCASHWR